MAKYKALQDILPNVKAGDIVEVKDEIIPEYKKLLEPYNGDEEVTIRSEETVDTDKTAVVNPSRDELKARATELGINFASNIPTERLLELVKEAEEKDASGSDDKDSDKDSDDKKDQE
jgi:hypothetical protein